ncbi:MAG: phasin family protein [Nitrospirae bacterium]|nr:phasin family protein [Nitrospirota bacterium]
MMNINELWHKTLMAGLGVPEKMKEMIDDLVKKGELSESQGAKFVKEWSEKAGKTGDDISKSMTDLINSTLEKMNIPTKEEVEKLERKVTALSARVKKLEGASGTSD